MLEKSVVPIIWRGTAKAWEQEPGVCAPGWGFNYLEKEPAAVASEWLVG
jgi:hypothetical protein